MLRLKQGNKKKNNEPCGNDQSDDIEYCHTRNLQQGVFNTSLQKGDSFDEKPGDTEKNADDAKEDEIHASSPFLR